MRVLVTRAQAAAEALAESLREEGAFAICMPAIETVPSGHASIAEFAPDPDEAAIFTSVPAVESFFAHPFFSHPDDAAKRLTCALLAVGPASAAALKERGVNGALLPPKGSFDSEGLLALPALAPKRIRGRRVWIVKGEGGRRLLGDTLRKRGARVCEFCLYRRRAPSGLAAALDDLGHRGGLASIDAIVLASVATFEYLLRAAAWVPAWLADIPLIVAGERIAASIRSKGFERVVVAADASHASFIDALVDLRPSSVDEAFERERGCDR
ncbi:MAG: uroporphyrinogen-III synthase [Ectothiorhodospiraceae bacterium AqS1]|nr:uroporphyrinogen-III synthase [Ectothiorhodospiraceae bacterium AqS1]